MGNFSFSLSVFKRLVLQTHEKTGLVWERVNMVVKLTKNIVGKRENTGYHPLLLFPGFVF